MCAGGTAFDHMANSGGRHRDAGVVWGGLRLPEIPIHRGLPGSQNDSGFHGDCLLGLAWWAQREKRKARQPMFAHIMVRKEGEAGSKMPLRRLRGDAANGI